VGREDAWDLCRVALNYGGVEFDDCRFAFADKEQWLTALETLCFRFGPEYFEAVDLDIVKARTRRVSPMMPRS
jgi:hypothetical protein